MDSHLAGELETVRVKITYRVVDMDGDEICIEHFTRNVPLPVRTRSIELRQDAEADDGVEMIIALEYLHSSQRD